MRFEHPNAVVLFWFSLVCFGVRVSVTFCLNFVLFTLFFGSVATFLERATHSVDHMFSFVF